MSNDCFPDACILIGLVIRDTVKNDRAVSQPFQIISLVVTLLCDCARL
jgi:hypothetical protein